MARAWPAYFGTFSVDAAERTVTHHVESDWFPNLADTEPIRHYTFDGDRLVLVPRPRHDRVDRRPCGVVSPQGADVASFRTCSGF
jgi:lipocalin-like protein